jgi:ribosomal protein L17
MGTREKRKFEVKTTMEKLIVLMKMDKTSETRQRVG